MVRRKMEVVRRIEGTSGVKGDVVSLTKKYVCPTMRKIDVVGNWAQGNNFFSANELRHFAPSARCLTCQSLHTRFLGFSSARRNKFVSNNAGHSRYFSMSTLAIRNRIFQTLRFVRSTVYQTLPKQTSYTSRRMSSRPCDDRDLKEGVVEIPLLNHYDY